MRAHKKGFILIAVIVFSIAALIATLAFYTAITAIHKIVVVGETDTMRGYYTALGGLRYASIMITDHNITSHLYTKSTWSVRNEYPDLYADLGISAPYDLTIDIRPNVIDPPGSYQTYTVKATYSKSGGGTPNP